MKNLTLQNTLLLRLIGWATPFLFWYLITAFHLVDPLFIPSPIDTAKALWHEIFDGELAIAAFITVGLALSGLGIGIVIGVPVGLALGGIHVFRKMFGGFIDALRSVPSTAIFPVFLLLFGVGRASKIATAAFVCTLALAIYTAAGVPEESSTRRFLLKLHGVSRLQYFLDGLFYPTFASIIGGVKAATSMSLVITVANEMIVGTDLGLGRYIYNAQLTFHIPEMYAAIVITAGCGVLLNGLLESAVKKVRRWDEFDKLS